jgi:hypothetical protein
MITAKYVRGEDVGRLGECTWEHHESAVAVAWMHMGPRACRALGLALVTRDDGRVAMARLPLVVDTLTVAVLPPPVAEGWAPQRVKSEGRIARISVWGGPQADRYLDWCRAEAARLRRKGVSDAAVVVMRHVTEPVNPGGRRHAHDMICVARVLA